MPAQWRNPSQQLRDEDDDQLRFVDRSQPFGERCMARAPSKQPFEAWGKWWLLAHTRPSRLLASLNGHQRGKDRQALSVRQGAIARCPDLRLALHPLPVGVVLPSVVCAMHAVGVETSAR
jgi:hypothetical protein